MRNDCRKRISVGLSLATLALTMTGCSGSDPEQAAQSSSTSEEPQVQQEPAEDYAIDECLVGVWTTVSQREQTMVNGAEVVLIDVERQLTFSSDGVETVKYFDTPAQVQSPTGESLGEVTQSGEHTFQVNTDDEGIINFEPTGGEVTAIFNIRGESFTLIGEGGNAPVNYTCSAGELTQNATGYEAVFTRAV